MQSKPLERKLAAILYADVAGYSRLTGEDEEGTHRALTSFFDTMNAIIDQHDGKVLNYAGDAVLAEFLTVSDALTCALAIQGDLKQRNKDLPDNRKLQFRIGVNLGDVIVARNEIFGDGVNVAARLESLAEPGGICISEAVRSVVGNKLPLECIFLGAQRLKNIAEPVKAYHVRLKPGAVLPTPTRRARSRPVLQIVIAAATVISLIVGISWWQPWIPWMPPIPEGGISPSLPNGPSIAVLPFDNLGADPGQEYFSDGVTMDITTDLSKFGSLYVIGGDSVLVYKGKPVIPQEISRELGVRYLLEGSVQKAGNKIRVNAQLVDAQTGRHLWAERYLRDLTDVFAVQDEIVQTIVTALAVNVSAVERERVMRKDTDSLEAYDYVLRGWEYLSRTTRSANLAARKMFQAAIELDPRYGAAYVGLGWTFRREIGHGWTEFPHRALRRAHELAQQALGIEESAAAFQLLGYIYLVRREYGLANNALRRAIELNPNDWDSLAVQGAVLLYTGQRDAAIRAYETALRFNPRMDIDRLFELGMAYFLDGRYDDAIRILEEGVGRNPNHPFSHAVLAAAYAEAGTPDDAQRAAATVRRLHPFFDATAFGTRFRNPEDQARITQGMQKGGLR